MRFASFWSGNGLRQGRSSDPACLRCHRPNASQNWYRAVANRFCYRAVTVVWYGQGMDASSGSTPGPIRHLRRPYEIGQALRSLRRRAGLTQQGAAEAAGVSRKWLSAAENGKQTINVNLLLDMLDAFGYEIDLIPIPASEAALDDHLGSLHEQDQW